MLVRQWPVGHRQMLVRMKYPSVTDFQRNRAGQVMTGEVTHPVSMDPDTSERLTACVYLLCTYRSVTLVFLWCIFTYIVRSHFDCMCLCLCNILYHYRGSRLQSFIRLSGYRFVRSAKYQSVLTLDFVFLYISEHVIIGRDAQ